MTKFSFLYHHKLILQIKITAKLKKYNKDNTFETIARPYNTGPPNEFRHQQHTKSGKYVRGHTMQKKNWRDRMKLPTFQNRPQQRQGMGRHRQKQRDLEQIEI